ncbi:VOC family protein [Rubrivirga marina]|uniref:Glyoxalase n=1 Tax=Rubrivirga marina TaxID=1196024 RepID=A0A271IYS5_9BACT|nr:VOC family protein [Rubrivirga marina]PAP76280.1 glyoxalase [Rubrivirga marina]
MLGAYDSSAIVAVRDLDRARAFYGDLLGLDAEADAGTGVLLFKTGATTLVVYPSEEAGTNRANAVVFSGIADLDAVVGGLRDRGVTFEHYDLPGLTLDGDVHRRGDDGFVWFKDPDGNLLHLTTL